MQSETTLAEPKDLHKALFDFLMFGTPPAPPTKTDRLVLADITARTALDCLNDDPPDVAAAKMFLADALMHLHFAFS